MKMTKKIPKYALTLPLSVTISMLLGSVVGGAVALYFKVNSNWVLVLVLVGFIFGGRIFLPFTKSLMKILSIKDRRG